ncbi:alpha/beta-hydrolase [Thozetella sp. PMI_491]|nr:alpha/beta-hydrolase [Thozetella sp. PMI_491]
MAITTPEKPVFVIVPGAWHKPLHYLNIAVRLQATGYRVSAIPLPTAGWEPGVGTKTIADSAHAVRAVIQPYIDAGREVVVVCHSFGGLPTTDGVVGETVEDRRARGAAGGVKAVFFLSAMACGTAGNTMVEVASNGVGPQDRPEGEWWEIKGDVMVLKAKAKDFLYNDASDELASLFLSATVPHSAATPMSICQHAATEINASRFYIACERDRAIAYQEQLKFATNAGAKVVNIAADHSPFATPEGAAEVVKTIEECLAEVAAA